MKTWTGYLTKEEQTLEDECLNKLMDDCQLSIFLFEIKEVSRLKVGREVGQVSREKSRTQGTRLRAAPSEQQQRCEAVILRRLLLQ